MDRKRYVPDNQVLHPGAGQTEYYQDANGAVFRVTRNDAHGNKFTTNYALDPATRYGYSGPGAPPPSPYGADPAQQYGYTVLGGQSPAPHRAPSMPGWGPAPGNFGGPDLGARLDSAVSNVTGRNAARSGEADGASVLAFIALVLLVAALPLGIACVVHRRARRSRRDVRQAVITIGLAEPAWALMLWAWLGGHALWPALVALLLPAGYAVFARLR
jgi:hypothetical protein